MPKKRRGRSRVHYTTVCPPLPPTRLSAPSIGCESEGALPCSLHHKVSPPPPTRTAAQLMGCESEGAFPCLLHHGVALGADAPCRPTIDHRSAFMPRRAFHESLHYGVALGAGAPCRPPIVHRSAEIPRRAFHESLYPSAGEASLTNYSLTHYYLGKKGTVRMPGAVENSECNSIFFILRFDPVSLLGDDTGEKAPTPQFHRHWERNSVLIAYRGGRWLVGLCWVVQPSFFCLERRWLSEASARSSALNRLCIIIIATPIFNWSLPALFVVTSHGQERAVSAFSIGTACLHDRYRFLTRASWSAHHRHLLHAPRIAHMISRWAGRRKLG